MSGGLGRSLGASPEAGVAGPRWPQVWFFVLYLALTVAGGALLQWAVLSRKWFAGSLCFGPSPKSLSHNLLGGL